MNWSVSNQNCRKKTNMFSWTFMVSLLFSFQKWFSMFYFLFMLCWRVIGQHSGCNMRPRWIHFGDHRKCPIRAQHGRPSPKLKRNVNTPASPELRDHIEIMNVVCWSLVTTKTDANIHSVQGARTKVPNQVAPKKWRLSDGNQVGTLVLWSFIFVTQYFQPPWFKSNPKLFCMFDAFQLACWEKYTPQQFPVFLEFRDQTFFAVNTCSRFTYTYQGTRYLSDRFSCWALVRGPGSRVSKKVESTDCSLL